MSQDPAALASVEALVRARQKIQAIKGWRELSGYGLKEAKDAVEHFESHGAWRPSDLANLAARHGQALAEAAMRARARAEAELEAAYESGGGAARLTANAAPAPQVADIVELARGGRKIDAIKLFRERFGVGLAEAKNAVESLVDGRAGHRAAPHAANAAVQPPSRAVQGPGPVSSVLTAAQHHAVSQQPVSQQPVTQQPLAQQHAAPPPRDPELARALAVLAEKQGVTATPLAATRGESGLFKGHLVLTQERLFFVADRYGNLEVTEDVLRKDLESVEVKKDPFGFELVVRAGFHRVEFAGLEEAAARHFAAWLEGREPPRLEQPSPAPSVQNEAAANSVLLGATASSQWSYQQPPELGSPAPAVSQGSAPQGSAPPLGSPAPAQLVTGPQAPYEFSGRRVFFLTLFAAIPLTAFGSTWRFLPMEDFPQLAYAVLYWAALALGAGFGGSIGAMLKASVPAALLSWGLTSMGSYDFANVASVAVLGATYAHQQPGKYTGLGVVLAVPVMVLNALLGLIVTAFVMVPTMGFSFWFVHFLVADLKKARANTATAAAKAA